MNPKYSIFTITFLVVTVSGCCNAICCGRGRKGFCKDCSRVGFRTSQKCCGGGSGKGFGCNIFCCNCGTCRTGRPKIRYHSGWWLGATYSCGQYSYNEGDSLGAAALSPSDEISKTRAKFEDLDVNKDGSLNPNEFSDGLRVFMRLDSDISHSYSAEFMKYEDADGSLPAYDLHQEGQTDTFRSVMTEFVKMDINNDGFIQAKEFDKDL